MPPRKRAFQTAPHTGVSADEPLTGPEDVSTIARPDARTDARPRVRESAPTPLRSVDPMPPAMSPRDRARYIRDVQADALALKSALDRVDERQGNLRESAQRAMGGGLLPAELDGICALVGLPMGTLDGLTRSA